MQFFKSFCYNLYKLFVYTRLLLMPSQILTTREPGEMKIKAHNRQGFRHEQALCLDLKLFQVSLSPNIVATFAIRKLPSTTPFSQCCMSFLSGEIAWLLLCTRQSFVVSYGVPVLPILVCEMLFCRYFPSVYWTK